MRQFHPPVSNARVLFTVYAKNIWKIFKIIFCQFMTSEKVRNEFRILEIMFFFYLEIMFYIFLT